MRIRTETDLGVSLEKAIQEDERDLLAPIWLDLNRKQRVFSEGEPATHLFLVMDGLIEESVDHPRDDRKKLTTALVGSGDLFGLDAVLGKRERHSTSAQAAERSLLLGIPGNQVVALMSSNPQIAQDLYRLMSTRVENAEYFATLRAYGDSGQLVASAILDYAQAFGLPAITQDRLAKRTGLARESGTREGLDFLVGEGAITKHVHLNGNKGSSLRIPTIDKNKLETFVGQTTVFSRKKR